MENTEGLRQVEMTEDIQSDDMYFIDGKLQFVKTSMVGKTIYQVSLDYFGPDANKLLTIFRFNDNIEICDPARVKVHVAYCNTK